MKIRKGERGLSPFAYWDIAQQGSLCGSKEDIVKNLFLFALALTIMATACGLTRYKSSYTYDDGVHPVQQVTYAGNAASVGFPPPLLGAGGLYSGGIGLGAYGYGGYGYLPTIAGGNLCIIHPDACDMVMEVGVRGVAPQHHGSSQGESGLHQRVGQLEKETEALGGAYRVIVKEGRKTNKRVSELEKRQGVILKVQGQHYKLDRAQCAYLKENPSVITDASLRSKAAEACNEILGANDATEEGGAK